MLWAQVGHRDDGAECVVRKVELGPGHQSEDANSALALVTGEVNCGKESKKTSQMTETLLTCSDGSFDTSTSESVNGCSKGNTVQSTHPSADPNYI